MTKTAVLVVDDEPVIVELVRDVLDEHRIVEAYDVASARAAVTRGEQFDVAIIDKNLPDGSGLEFVRWLKAARPDCEALVMTGYPSMDSAVEAISAGATDYLIKPMRNIAELRMRVNNALDRVLRRRAEVELSAELKESEERYRELFEATPDAVLVLDGEHRTVLAANIAAERLYQRSRNELVGLHAAALTAPHPLPELRGGVIIRHELRPGNITVPVEVTTKLTRRGNKALVVEVVRDVSERERAATERNELEQRLIRAGRLEALGRLAAGIAHDFNNLLCVISMGSELAAELMKADPDAAHAELETIGTAVESATRLTRQLLAFSGRQLTRTQAVDVNARVELVGRMLERALGPRTKLVLDLAPMPLAIAIDPGHFEQVITNLALNARDAMPSGGTITIITRGARDPQGVTGIAIDVADTGTGIPADVLANIFEPFFTTKGPEKGTGLGLATVQEVVRRASGTIAVTSQSGAGTTFTLWFPQTDGSIHMTTQLSTFVPAGRGENVLVIEDDAKLRDVTRRVLSGGGYAVHEVRDGEEALAYVRDGARVDVVVADIELPGMSGVECAREIAQRHRETRILYTSGMTADPRGDQPDRNSTFLPKPYSPDELMRSVRKALDAKS